MTTLLSSMLSPASAFLLVGSTISSSSDPLMVPDPSLGSAFASSFICPLASRGSFTGFPVVRRSPSTPTFSLPLNAPLILFRQTGH